MPSGQVVDGGFDNNNGDYTNIEIFARAALSQVVRCPCPTRQSQGQRNMCYFTSSIILCIIFNNTLFRSKIGHVSNTCRFDKGSYEQCFQDALLRKTSRMTVMTSLTKLWRANRIALTTVKQFWVGIFGRGTQGTSAVG